MELNKKESFSLRFLYKTFFGRLLLKILCSRFVSRICGVFLDSALSKPLIKRFIKCNSINLADYKNTKYGNFNECFSRQIKEELRPIDLDKSAFISPCDGLLSVYKINDGLVLPIKQSEYSIKSLLKDESLSNKYKDGICLVFRLCVNHYHRYCYVDNGKKGNNIFIKGKLHTVRPIALEHYPVFSENCREYTVMETENFGMVTQIEVGAMLVGKIKNLHQNAEVIKGQEKGMFLYGGSTIVVLLEENTVNIREDILNNSKNNIETPVIMGEKIANKIN